MRFLSALFCLMLLFLLACEQLPPTVPPTVIARLDAAEARRISDSIRQATPVQLAEGLDLTLWASDSLLLDPIALHLDPQGRAYVTSTRRGTSSEFDIRGHRNWMTLSISWDSLQQRHRFLRDSLSPERSDLHPWIADLNGDSLNDWRDLAVEAERVIRIEDSDNDGLADYSQVFVEGFKEEFTDVAGALLGYEGDFFLGVAPDLWRLRDRNNDGTVDEMTSLVHGFQVHIGFGGHGMSGLTVGPDGRLYWSIGDIGFDITGPDGRKWHYPHQGAIFRSNLDGSEFEVYAAGLRNTHEFDFDAHGNLITVDNDGDHEGEEERLMYVVEGSDAGWRANWQYGKYTDPDNNGYNVWMDEKLFKPRHDSQAAYIVPPIQNYHSGPTGLKYQPGTALGGRWANHFFVVEFPGAPSRAKIHAFELEEQGAGFKLKQEEVLAQGVLATGLDIGSDGAMYFSDWITGWVPKGYGRIWKMDSEGPQPEALRQEVQDLLRSPWDKRSTDELVNLLGHPDMRVRKKAQFALAGKGASSAKSFLSVLEGNTDQLARIHAIWGYGQLLRQKKGDLSTLMPYLNDEDPEIQAQVIKTLGDLRDARVAEQLIALLRHESPRVKFFAAEALGKIRHQPAIQPLIDMLAANNDNDVYLRHSGAFALAQIGQVDPLLALAKHPSEAVRLAAVVALRRMQAPGLALFLDDASEKVVTEAARAIHDDNSVPEALPALAAYAEKPSLFMNEPLLRRVVSAASRLGRAEDLDRLLKLVQREDLPAAIREEALSALAVWALPSPLDRVDGRYRGESTRDAGPVVTALTPLLPQLWKDPSPSMLVAAVKAVGKLKVPEQGNKLMEFLRSGKTTDLRIASLESLALLGGDWPGQAIRTGLAASDPAIRSKALSLLPTLNLPGDQTPTLLAQVIRQGQTSEKQAAMATLGKLPVEQARPVVEAQLIAWEENRLAADLQVELAEVIDRSAETSWKSRLGAIRAADSDDPLLGYADALLGGNERAGRRIFYQHEAAQCLRCHALDQPGSEVGPRLTGVGARLKREDLLLSLVAPSQRLAPGYGTAFVKMKDGSEVQGLLLSENEREIRLQTEQAEPIRYAKSDIETLRMAPSSMPPMGQILTRRELRDVVAFLAELK